MGLGVNVDRKGMLGLVATAINDMMHKPKDAFWTGKAMDMMFDGLPLDCTSEDFNTKAVCSVFEAGESQQIEPNGEDHFKFSLLNGVSMRSFYWWEIVGITMVMLLTFPILLVRQYNDTSNGVFKVLRGIKNVRDLGKVLEIDGEDEHDAWDGDECNEIKGTDGLIFPPFGKKEEPIVAVEKLVCRSFDVPFERKTKYRGIPVHMFTYDLGDIANTESERCYCRNEDECPLKGTIDLFPCLGVPITLSMPHFYNADPSLLDAVEGLSPNKKDHEIFLKMELVNCILTLLKIILCNRQNYSVNLPAH